MTRRVAAMTTLMLAGAMTGCVGLLNEEFGDQGMQHQRFIELDSALGMHLGARILLRAQRELGQDQPARLRPNVVSFSGTVTSLDDGWVHMVRDETDTVRIGKGSVVGAWLLEDRSVSRHPGILIGAVTGAALSWIVIQARGAEVRPDRTAQVAIVLGSGFLGGALGGVLWGDEARGARLYPIPPPPEPEENEGAR